MGSIGIFPCCLRNSSEARRPPKQRLDRRFPLFLRRRRDWERDGVLRITFLALPNAGDAIAAEIALVVVFRVLEDLDVAVLIFDRLNLLGRPDSEHSRAFAIAASGVSALTIRCAYS